MIDEHGKSLIYQYDAVGNRTVLTDSDGQDTTWAYDALNHNIALTVIGQGTTTIDHYPSGRVHVLTRPDASTTTTEYDEAGRIASIVHAKAGTELAQSTYRYDLNGNRIEQKQTNGAVTGDVEQTTGYSYDASDRLTQVVTPDRTTDYTLDPVGNRTGEKIHNAANTLIGDSTLVYNAREQLTSRDDAATSLHVDLTWDADGNTATQTDPAGTRTFTYDAHDRLLDLAMPAQLPLTFDYNADGLRIAKHQGSAETRYQYDQQSLLAETNAIGNTTVAYHYSATQLLSRTEAGSTPNQRQYLSDALNTPIATLTQQGAVDSRTKFDAWGEIVAQQGIGGAVTTPETDGTTAPLIATDNQDISFTGYIKDSESGLYYAKARYYDPRIARFTTEDPEQGKAMNPPSLHRYLYAYANPTVYVDPTGKIETLANGANEISTWNKWLGQLAHEQSNNTLGHLISGGVGIGRGLLGLTEGALRTVNFAANGVVVASTSVPAAFGYLPKYGEGPAKELQGTVEATQQTYTFLRNGGVETLYNKSAEAVVRARAGDNEAISEVSSVVSSVVAPSRAAGMTVEEAGNAARQVASDAATQARNVAQQTKNAVGGARRIVEDAAGSGADAVPVSPSVADATSVRERVLTNLQESEAARRSSNFDLHPKRANKAVFDFYRAAVEKADVDTLPNTATFYSGPGNRVRAEQFARNNGWTTLEQTPGGSWLDNRMLFGPSSPLSPGQATLIWGRLSQRYAEGASGTVVGFVKGARPNRTFNAVEYPELLENPKVTNVITGGN
ncbi:MAG TPA: RHS repeat-associated core domain-containing protein [Rudaea sp.]|nr:RHS repeat-associated core domain-containing protein [Rudaea sp.]